MNYGTSIWWNTDTLNLGFFPFIYDLQNIKCLYEGFFSLYYAEALFAPKGIKA